MAKTAQFLLLNAPSLPWADYYHLKLSFSSTVFEPHTAFVKLVVLGLSMVPIIYFMNLLASCKDDIPTVNRRFALEPRIFSRIRWAFWSVKILDDAHEKYQGRAYRLARGDADIIVLPSRFITELNKLPQNMISSRKSHSLSLTGYLNGMDVVQKTNRHVKMLLTRVTPALPELLKPASRRIERSMLEMFSQDTASWNTVEPLDKVVHCISQAIALAVFGTPTCDNPKLIRLCYEHTRNVFSIMFIMRLVPRFLQPMAVWLLPDKWRLERSWKELEDFVVPEVQRRKNNEHHATEPDLISWMLTEAKNDEDTDPYMLTRLVGSVIAGGTYSSAAFIVGVLADLVAHPQSLEEIREEIREKHNEIHGNWDQAAFNSLDKLDSAMKETSRLAPGSLLVYSRVMEANCTLSDGLRLKKGQLITTSGHSAAMDPNIFPNPKRYNAMRAYNRDLEAHRAQPFRSVEGDDHRWGAGRWACPGRFIASLVSKVILVKLLDEYDFRFVGGERPPTTVMHEFVFFKPSTKIMMRRRARSSGIKY